MSEFSLQPGSIGVYQGAKIKVREVIGLKEVILENLDTGARITANRKRLVAENLSKQEDEQLKSVTSIKEKDWEKAEGKLKIIERMRNGDSIQEIIDETGIPRSTLYRWAKLYNESGAIHSLIEGRGKSLAGKKKLDTDLEELITNAINTIYLTPDRGSKKQVIEYIKARCKEKKWSPPHSNTIRQRIALIDDGLKEKSRNGPKAWKDKYKDKTGHFPEPVSALHVVQIDHTPVDLIFVDPVYRLPIATRVNITSAIDVKTRMLTGYYMSFFKPGFVAAGLCIINSVLPKDELLVTLKVEGDWPCWGFPKFIFMDNAKEFQGKSMERSCERHKIKTEYRPLGTPEYGAHVESFIKTLQKAVHDLPGTTWSNVKEKGTYDSAKHAAFTLEEFEAWFVEWVVNTYHESLHSSIKTSPIKAWEKEIIKSGFQKFPNEAQVRIDFLPLVYRTVQDYGVQKDSITYFAPVLKKFINRIDKASGKAKLKKQFEFRWDPRNLRTIYFLNPDTDKYEEIEIADARHRLISVNIWEWKAAKKHLVEQGVKQIDEEKIFRSIVKREQMVEKAVSETKKVRKAHQKAKKQTTEKKSSVTQKKSENPFDDIDLDFL
ncbi:MAG: helix-turn-helix domain-containing protein [Cyclobacteriaceae bacterium]